MGSISEKKLTQFLGILSFSNARLSGNEANKTMVVAPTTGFTQRSAQINGVNYALGAVVNRAFYPLTGLDGSFLKNGERFLFNMKTAAGVPLYADRTLKAGKVYVWDGVQWIEEAHGYTQDEVDARVKAVRPWKTDSRGVITQAVFDAISIGDLEENTWYPVRG